jgi:hypothetical protein
MKVSLGSIPCPSTEIVGSPVLRSFGADLALSFEFENDDDARFTAGVEFSGVRAFRKRAEKLCSAWHIEEAYDTVVEVSDSDWVSELKAAADPEWRDHFRMRHFMIYLDSFGALEVVGAEALVLPALAVSHG